MKSVLVVEDEQTLRDAYRFILQAGGYNVLTAQDGNEAIKIVKRIQPDLVLLDLLMPKADGLTFLKGVQATKKQPGMKVIVFSNLSEPDKIQEALRLGAINHIIKSDVSPKQILAAVKHYI